MKALLTAFALLSFVAASTVPYVTANAATPTHKTVTHHKKKMAKAKKKTHKKVTKSKKGVKKATTG